jgi:hypothetical protein
MRERGRNKCIKPERERGQENVISKEEIDR